MGLQTAPLREPVTVFLVGLQCRSWRSMWKALLIGRQMSKMQKELRSDPNSGFIWGKNFTGSKPFTSLFLSYWKSSADIQRFVSDGKFSHRMAVREYWQKRATDPHLGVWHETYEISPGKSESLYFGMDPFGLSAFLPSVPVERMSQAYVQRLRY